MSTDKGLYHGMQELSGATFVGNHRPDETIKQDILRAAADRGVMLPSGGQLSDRESYHGAVVFTPKAGLHKNVFYPDYSSLYPNVMSDGNMSPETIIGIGDETLLKSSYTKDEVRWSYVDPRPVKVLDDSELYSNFTDGNYKIVVDGKSGDIKWRDDWSRIQEYLEPIYYKPPSDVAGLLASRTETYIRWNKQYEGIMYDATKAIRNSVYGVSGFQKFPLFDWRVAESITIGGRLLLEYGRDILVDRLGAEFGEDNVYVTHGDTDGVGISVDADVTRGHLIPTVEETVEWLNGTGIPAFVEETFGVPADETAHEVDLESYAPKLFVPGDGDGGIKKTYAEHITVEDGHECDAIDITGFEAERSDVADVTEEVQSQVLEWILTEPRTEARQQIYELIQTTVNDINGGSMPLAKIGQRSGLSKPPAEYGSPNRSAHPIYRGAKYAKQHIDGENSFDKPMKFPVSRVRGDYPAVYNTDTAESGTKVDYISVENPDNIPDEIEIDREQVVESVLRQPLRNILQTMGWSFDEALDGHEQSGLQQFAITSNP